LIISLATVDLVTFLEALEWMTEVLGYSEPFLNADFSFYAAALSVYFIDFNALETLVAECFTFSFFSAFATALF
jgi:hypothetical protein